MKRETVEVKGALRCSICRKIADDDGNVVIPNKQMSNEMDCIDNKFIAMGWRVGVRCPNCSTN